MFLFSTVTCGGKRRFPATINALRMGLRTVAISRGGSTTNIFKRHLMSNQAAMSTSVESMNRRLKRVRQIMSREAIDALIVPTDDPHLNEYIAPHFGRREYISSFTGSAGVAVITDEKAFLFTDGRYHKQAEMELSVFGNEWSLMKVGVSNVPTHTDYLLQTMTSGCVVGIDPLVHSSSSVQTLKESLGAKNVSVKYLSTNPIDEVWQEEQNDEQSLLKRPPIPRSNIRIHPLKFAGKSTREKLAEIRDQMQKENEKCDSLILTALDEIMWLLNIRGSDVPCNPVSYCYCIVQRGIIPFSKLYSLF
jgi:Xaa-Pro aminopeptidase